MRHADLSKIFSSDTASTTFAKRLAGSIPMIRNNFESSRIRHENTFRNVKNPISQAVIDRAKEMHEMCKEGADEWDNKIKLG